MTAMRPRRQFAGGSRLARSDRRDRPRPPRGRALRALILTFALTIATTTAVTAAQPDATTKRITDRLLAAIVANDQAAFVAGATQAVADGTTPAIMSALSRHLGARLKGGYEQLYLCPLNQAGHDVHLWKVTFADGGDDVVVRVVLKDGEVAGFFLQ